MAAIPPQALRARIDHLYREEGGRVLASLIRLLGNYARAEDAMHDAFSAALQRWGEAGVPENPRAWLISTGRFKAIDALRRSGRLDTAADQIAQAVHGGSRAGEGGEEWPDDRLKLIFTCCHPVVPPETRSALTLREVCGLTTEEIARAFLMPATTLAQRIVRAKARLREERVPYQVPDATDLPERLLAVWSVIYLLFNEGYLATSGPDLLRADLSIEAIRLGRILLELKPEPETQGLLALMLLQESRRSARTGLGGDLVLLEAQDRSLWDRALIAEGIGLVESALASRRFGPYTLQAAIAAVHAEAKTAAETDWRQIVALYNGLHAVQPTPVVELNRAVAVAMHFGADEGLRLIDALLARGELTTYLLAHSARADLCRRLGRNEDARASYQRALDLGPSETECRYLRRRMAELS